MDKPFKENPFLHSDIDQGGGAETYKADDSVIPVRTWAHGSPFNLNSHGARTQANTSASKRSHASGESSGEYGDLDKYWPDPAQKEGAEEGEEEEEAPLHDASFADESVQSVQSDRPEQASANYDTTDLSDAFVTQFNRVIGKYTPKEVEQEQQQEEEEEEYADDYVEEEDDDDEEVDEEGPLSYEDSEAIHSRAQSRASAAGAAAQGDGDIGDLAAYLGMGETEGENIFFPPGADDADADDDDDGGFMPHGKDWAKGAGGAGAGPSGGGERDDPRGHLEEIVSEYQRIYAALQSPQHDQQGQRRERERDRGGERAAAKDNKAGATTKAARAERDQLRLLKRARREREREAEREAVPVPDGALGAEQRHRRYLAEVASKRRAEDDMLLAMVGTVPLPFPLPPLISLSFSPVLHPISIAHVISLPLPQPINLQKN